MTTWHILLYSVAAFLALRSFVQLVTNYRNEYEYTAVTNHLTAMKDEMDKELQAEMMSEEELAELAAPAVLPSAATTQ